MGRGRAEPADSEDGFGVVSDPVHEKRFQEAAEAERPDAPKKRGSSHEAPARAALSSILTGAAFGQHADAVQWRVEDGGNGHWYQAVYVPCEIDWGDADTSARARTGSWHLATVHSDEENSFVYDLVDEPAFWNTSVANAAGPWLGGVSSCGTCNNWQWATGEPGSYTNWGPLEPFGNGEYLGLYGYQSSMGDGWNDIGDGWDVFGYVVETAQTPRGPRRSTARASIRPGASSCNRARPRSARRW